MIIERPAVGWAGKAYSKARGAGRVCAVQGWAAPEGRERLGEVQTCKRQE
jgi:hypothetical protein